MTPLTPQPAAWQEGQCKPTPKEVLLDQPGTGPCSSGCCLEDRPGLRGCIPCEFTSVGPTEKTALEQIPKLEPAANILGNLTRMQRYWECGGDSGCEGPSFREAERGKYLTFEPFGGGLNNERMALELAFTLAYLFKRTLVLPPTMRHDARMVAARLEA